MGFMFVHKGVCVYAVHVNVQANWFKAPYMEEACDKFSELHGGFSLNV